MDSIPNYTFNTFIYANFYETVGKKKEALEIYKNIQKQTEISHFVYYKLAVKRITELEKQNPTLLDSVYFETGRPDFKVCEVDNEKRIREIKRDSLRKLKNKNGI
ncbi:hypothetical protein [Flavobacterium phycosphaerae]|uniref:hypothetical protein n=1 Tax=Flavobacterium phycosphaerae TaxID=2697515 RepID=UPI0013895400|nr:hypothetical protein [Flavobacterium phycosphaerae]